jgi:Carboxypeptidase regulatory-like domain
MKTMMTNRAGVRMRPVAHAALALALFAPCLPAQLPTLQSNAPDSARVSQPELRGRIQGVVFDSLIMQPMPHATVMLMGTGRSTISDSRGRFSFDTVAVGAYEVGFSAAALDSIGLGVLGGAVTVTANQSARVTVATPSFHTLWSNRCTASNRFGTDSTLVWGTVRDAVSDSLLTGAVTTFSWYDLLPKKTTQLVVDEIRFQAVTDNSGNYFACGLPGNILVSVRAVTAKAASGLVEYAIGSRRLYYAGLLVSSDMIVSDTMPLLTRQDSLEADRLRGRAGVRGIVVNEKGAPLADALVVVADLDSAVRTGADGMFRVGALPAGTQTLHVRRVGSAPVTQLVHLRPDTFTEATVRLSDNPTLATVNVRSSIVKGRDRSDYENRRRFGLGFAIEGAKLNRRPDVYGALLMLPGVTVTPASFGIKAEMRSGGIAGGVCTPTTFLNGTQTEIELASSFPIDEYRAIEVFVRPVQVPAEYYRFGGCGAILFWTRNARW